MKFNLGFGLRISFDGGSIIAPGDPMPKKISSKVTESKTWAYDSANGAAPEHFQITQVTKIPAKPEPEKKKEK